MASKSINRTVAVAWAPSSQYSSLIATGTLAGALDDTFSTTAELEIHDLMLGDRHNTNASCRATIPSPARYSISHFPSFTFIPLCRFISFFLLSIINSYLIAHFILISHSSH